ncbi:MAG: ribonuclease P protein component [Mariprofundaceae bacterium]|nr:ribonuclease P protein component [Mariprofundaceae bacterium]
MPDHGFSSAYRLTSKADFAAMRRAKRVYQGGLQMVHGRNDFGHGRMGFAVSRKYGNSVARHQLKRHLREIFRQHPVRDMAVDVLVIPRHPHQQQVQIKHVIQQCFDRISALHRVK